MSEIHRPGRLAAALTLTGVAILSSASCAERQVNGIHIVDCLNGPKQASLTLELPVGQGIQIGGNDFGGDPMAYLTSEGKGIINLATLNKDRQVSLDNKGNLTIKDGNKSYDVKVNSENSSNTTELVITGTCN